MSAHRGRPRRPAASDASTPLDGLLQDLRDLRLTLAADLRAAAAAAEDGAAQVASDIVTADREELARFGRIAEMRMSRLSQRQASAAEPGAPEQLPSRWRRRVAVALPAVPLVGAMAVSAAAVTGVLPLPDRASARPAVAQPSPSSPVATSFQQLEAVVDSRGSSASEVIAAARRLHRELAALIAGTSDNPAQAAEVAELLRLEQSLLLRAQPPGASVVLDATRRLAQQLVDNTSSLPKPTSTTLPTPMPSATPKSTKTSSPAKQGTAPKPTSSTSPAPTASSSGGTIPVVP